MRPQRRGRAVVLGAGLAGLVVARVLAESYEQVVLVDRDGPAVGCAPRRGVPQGRHAHALLARGQQALEELLPGLTADLEAHGAARGDALEDVRLCFSGHRLRRGRSGLVVLSASRPFLEHHVRTRVLALPNVSTTHPCDVVGLLGDPGARRVVGARIRRRERGSAEEVLHADLVVDATGRGSQVPRWLAHLGCEPPAEERVDVDVGYASCTYRLPPGALDGDLGVVEAGTPDRPRGVALSRLEGGRWMLTLIGVAGDHPPTDPDGFLDFAASLRSAEVREAVRGVEPLDAPVAFTFRTSVRRHYERLRRFPDGLLVVGDAACSLNPVYGQGMTVAALQALHLRADLQRYPHPAPARLHARFARVVDAPWSMTVAADLALPGVPGRPSCGLRLLGAYVGRVHAGAAQDVALGRAFLRVSGLVDPPAALLRPAAVARVLRSGRAPAAAAPRRPGGAQPTAGRGGGRTCSP